MTFTITPYNKHWIIKLGFLLILIVLFFYLGFEKIFFTGPFGIHFMRQTDSLSFASNYFNNGFNFFQPQLYNLNNIEGRAACEFPITYYITALTYTIFGKHFFLQRIVHLIIAYFGAFAVFKLAKNILNDYWYALIISLFLFTSTVFNYYSFNYLPDIPALGFSFLGWLFIFNYRTNKKINALLLSFLFFALSSLIKITYLINPIAILVFAIIQFIFNKKEKFFSNNKKVILYSLITIIVVLIWNAYMFYYITIYSSNSFNTKALPIWILNKENIRIVWDHLSDYWYNKYFTRSIFYVFYTLIAFQVLFYKKSDKKISLLILVLFIGGLSYLILFFAQFKDHDYYFLAFFPLFFLLLINGINTFQNVISNKYVHLITKILLTGIVLLSINSSRSKLNNRFNKKLDLYSHAGLVIEKNLSAIDKLNIESDAKFIVGPDYCPNGGLFFLDRQGWNLKPNQITIENINTLKNKGADYLILASEDPRVLTVGDSTGIKILSTKELNIYRFKKN
ncbi:MAG: glycosyltransferase family 39 protein [Bacteroidota bacterium]